MQTVEKRPREMMLRREFASAVGYLNQILSEENHLQFIHWDFHKFAKRWFVCFNYKGPPNTTCIISVFIILFWFNASVSLVIIARLPTYWLSWVLWQVKHLTWLVFTIVVNPVLWRKNQIKSVEHTLQGMRYKLLSICHFFLVTRKETFHLLRIDTLVLQHLLTQYYVLKTSRTFVKYVLNSC